MCNNILGLGVHQSLGDRVPGSLVGLMFCATSSSIITILLALLVLYIYI